MPIDKRDKYVGDWVSTFPDDSSDYLVQYTITKTKNSLKVSAKDFRDNEKMKISNIEFFGSYLKFTSIMSSTKRKGINIFRARKGSIDVEFTFTVNETLKKVG